MAEEKKEKKIAALLRGSNTEEQTAVQVVPQYNLSSNKITEGKSEVATEELVTRISDVEALIPKNDIKIGKVSKKVDNLKSLTNKKFERITKKITEEIDIIAEGLDDNNKKVTKLSTLIEKQKKDGEKDSKNAEKGDNKIITILTNMLDFMKLTFEEDKLTREQQNNFSEEHNLEKERKDKELLEALKGRNVPTAEKIVEDDDKGGFFEKILGAMASILGPLKTFMNVLGKLFSTLSKFVTSFARFITSAGKILFSAARLLFSPLGLGLLIAAGAGYSLYKFYEWIQKNDQSKLSPSEAAAALSDEREVIAQAKLKFRKDEVTKDEIEETRKALIENVTGGRKRAEEIKAMPEGPEKENALQSIGGARKLEEILADKNEYKVPTGNEVEALPGRAIPRPDPKKGNPAATMSWDRQWKGILDPVTGLQLSVTNNKIADRMDAEASANRTGVPQNVIAADRMDAEANNMPNPIAQKIADRMDAEANSESMRAIGKAATPTSKFAITPEEARIALTGSDRDIEKLGGRVYLQRIANSTTPSTQSTPAAVPATPSTSSSTSEVTPVVPPPPKQVHEPVSSATPMPMTQNLGSKVADMSNDNALTKSAMEINITPNNSVNNVVATNKSNVPQAGNKIPSVRNQEETYQRMILDSTRMV